MRLRQTLLPIALTLAACSPVPAQNAETPPLDSSPVPTTASIQPAGTTTSSSVPSGVDVDYPICDYDEPWPAAPDDWYRDTPVYVGNNSPTDEVRRFASGLPGFETVWTDRDRYGWVSAGFVGVDVSEVQKLLEAEFPDDGVVAIELPYTRDELGQMASEIDAQLPEDMYALNYQEIWGRVEIFVGLLTRENVDIAATVAGDAPYCLMGLDPTEYDQSPQVEEGEGWVFLGVVGGWPESGTPVVMTDQQAIEDLWFAMGFERPAATLDFETYVAVAFPVLHSGSCPDQRFDGVLITPDRILPEIRDITIAQSCTSDGNPRTFLVGVERTLLPPPPVRWAGSEYDSQALEVSADLRTPGSSLGDTDTRVIELDRPRVATGMPLVMEPGFPWQLIVPSDCDLNYLGEVNGVGWHLAPDSEIPGSWAALAVDGLIDLEIELIQEPDPMVVLNAGGQQAVYLPGEKPTAACQP